jgi:hypothetical protein
MVPWRTNWIFDLPADAALATQLEAEADFAAGRIVPHKTVRERLAKLAREFRRHPAECALFGRLRPYAE